MKLLLSKTLWGVTDMQDECNWDHIMGKIKNDGFSAIESICLGYMSNPSYFKELLQKHELGLIIQMHTAGGYIKDGAYVYCSSCNIDDHVTSFRKQLVEALEMGAFIVNVHSGVDSWNIETALSYFEQVMAIEEELLKNSKFSHVTVVHETHRQRLLYSPFQARDILQLPQLKRLKINADLSHWVCVCEHVFDKNDARDEWWGPLLDIVADHCHLIHGRFGHAEGPQVYDPRCDEWKGEVAAHLDWWQTIWMAQQAKGMTCSYVTPEHGPPPYQVYFAMPKLTPVAASDIAAVELRNGECLLEQEKDEILWNINRHVGKLVLDRFAHTTFAT